MIRSYPDAGATACPLCLLRSRQPIPTVWPRRRALAYLNGLRRGVDRKNGWPRGEIHGEDDPCGIPYLRHRARGLAGG